MRKLPVISKHYITEEPKKINQIIADHQSKNYQVAEGGNPRQKSNRRSRRKQQSYPEEDYRHKEDNKQRKREAENRKARWGSRRERQRSGSSGIASLSSSCPSSASVWGWATCGDSPTCATRTEEERS